LAADESTESIKKKLEAVGVEDSVENHRKYRQLLFTAPEIELYISGVIMFDETLRQKAQGGPYNGVPFPQLLAERGIIPGIKVDEGKREMPGFPGEMITIGLDDLPKRLDEYKELGAKFTKWRAVINIDKDSPSDTLIHANAEMLAQYAAIVQSKGMVPIVEPEVLMDGDNNLIASEEATDMTLRAVFLELERHKVDYTAMLLKPNMIHQGKLNGEQRTPREIADATMKVLHDNVPREVPGIVFLSGGQSPKEAEENLRAINREGEAPWELTFSYGRALQEEALKIWAGKDENVPAAQKAFLEAAKRDGAASEGR
jgi:fructose-bisphosphate aldolase class I